MFTTHYIKVSTHAHCVVDVKEMNAKGASLMNEMTTIPFSQEFFDIKSAYLSEHVMQYLIENRNAKTFVTFNANKMKRLIQFIIHPSEPSFQIHSTTDFGETTLTFIRDKQGGLLLQFIKNGKSHATYLQKAILPDIYEAMRVRWLEAEFIR